MEFEMDAYGFELDSDAGTDQTGKMGSSLLSPNTLYNAGLYGGAKYCSTAKAGLDSEEEENFRWEDGRAETSSSEDPKFSERMDSLLNSLPKMNVGNNGSVGKDDKKPSINASDHAKIKSGPVKDKGNRSCDPDSRSKKYAAEVIWVEERRYLEKEKTERVKAWLLNSQFSTGI